MKRLTRMERCALIIGLILTLAGLYWVIWPKPGVVYHAANGPRGTPAYTGVEQVSAAGNRSYGLVAVALGVGGISLAFYRGKK